MPAYSVLSQFDGLSEVTLDINNPSVSRIKSLLFQPFGDLVFNSETGIGYSSKEMNHKALSFLDLARRSTASLVLTPEGSINIEIILDIINDKFKWPAIGKLWCLCSTGVPVDMYNRIRQLTICNENVYFIDSRLSYQHLHVNSIWYLFKINDSKLGIVVQHKTIHMKDIEYNKEADGLSLGETIYIFDLAFNKPKTQFFTSLICADAIGSSITDLFAKSYGHNLLLFNPQLNPKPYADDFKAFRTTLYQSTDIKECRLITLNWAAGTSINNKKAIINFPGSALTMPILGDHKVAFRSESFIKLRKKNRVKGLYLFYNYKWVWRMNPEEIIFDILINNPDAFEHNQRLSGMNEPECKDIFVFENNDGDIKLSQAQIIHCDNSFQKKLADNSNYTIPFPCSLNKDNECISRGCNLVFCDYFFGLCFGAIKYDSLDLEDESGKCITSVLDDKGILMRDRQIILFNLLVRNLVNNLLPRSLSYLENNNRFEIDVNAVITGSDQMYNLSPICGDTHKKAIVIIFDEYCLSVVIEKYKMIQGMTNKEYKDQIIIYYRDQTTQQFIPYEYPHEQKSIRCPTMTLNPTSIKQR